MVNNSTNINKTNNNPSPKEGLNGENNLISTKQTILSHLQTISLMSDGQQFQQYQQNKQYYLT